MRVSLAVLYTRASTGLRAPLVTVEVHLSQGLPGFSIVGLPEAEVRESKHRVRSAILNSYLAFPQKRITVNLAPADLPKQGSRFDLAIALGILAASNQIPAQELPAYEFAGELALSGDIRAIRGALPFAMATFLEKKELVMAGGNGDELSFYMEKPVWIAERLTEVCLHLRGFEKLRQTVPKKNVCSASTVSQGSIGWDDIIGQTKAKRALEVAAAGGHSVLLVGSPGSGKTLLATAFPSILPELSRREAQEVAAVYSLSHEGTKQNEWHLKPFRAPHHTASAVAMVGGGTPPYPGEISLAHKGTLFLDELPEFNRMVLETLREPLEARQITIARASYHCSFPADFQLLAAMNPCPCGLSASSTPCRCTPEKIARYRKRLSIPLLDRIDMHVAVSPPPDFMLIPKENVVCVKDRVRQARRLQLQRGHDINAKVAINSLQEMMGLPDKEKIFLKEAVLSLKLSMRGYHRILRVARTIADLEEETRIQHHHLTEALGYRAAWQTED